MHTLKQQQDCRRQNLKHLLKLFGSAAGLAKVSGIRRETLQAGQEGARQLSSRTCHRLETALGLPAGWLDHSHDAAEEAALRRLPCIAALALEDNGDDKQQLRLRNVELLVGLARGAQAEFCRQVGIGQADYRKLWRTTFGDRRARSFETKLGLPVGWLDAEHGVPVDLPAQFAGRLALFRGDPPSLALPNVEPFTVAVAGTCGPVARSLLETLACQANQGVLTEKAALALLNRVVGRT